MSAFIVSKRHIDALVFAGLHVIRYKPLRWRAPGSEFRALTRETADRVGQMLVGENVKSVRYRYGEGPLPGPMDGYWRRPYRYEQPFLPYQDSGTLVVVCLRLLSCYAYQACEHPEWERSEAKSFCDALLHELILSLPGYAEAPWTIE